MASNALGNSGGRLYSFGSQPVLIDCNFVIDSTNGNGLGIRQLKGQGVKAVYMNSSAGAPSGSPALGVARSYAVLGASAVSNTGSSVLTGNLGLSPGSSVTGFPPGTYSGVENIDNVAAVQAQAAALAAYNDLHSRSSTVIPSALDGQTLVPGVYSFASGAATLAASGNGTLTLNGNGVYVIQTATTLGTGAGGVPTIALTNGALASNVYWAIGSSATLNISGSGVFQGNVIANTSVTVDGGSVNGSVIALNGAVTFSAAVAAAAQPLAVNGSPAPGLAWIQLSSNYNRYLGGFSGFVSPVAGSPLAINSTALTIGNPYVIVSVGNGPEGQATITPVADVNGSLASKYFMLYDSYGNAFAMWFSVSGVGSAPLLGPAIAPGYNPPGSNQRGLQYVQVSILANATAAQIGAALVLIIENLPSGIVGTYSFTASGTSVVTVVSTRNARLAGIPQDGSSVIPSQGPPIPIYFTVSTASAAAGSVWTDGAGHLYTVSTALVSGTLLQTTGVGAPVGGVLTYVSGSGSTASISFSSAVAGLATGFSFALTVSDTNLQDWQAVGLPNGFTPTVGQAFIAKAVGAGGSTGLVQAPGVSGINSIEVIGDPNTTFAPMPQGGSSYVGAWILVQMLSNGVPSAPANGSVCGMSFYVDAKFSPSNIGTLVLSCK